MSSFVADKIYIEPRRGTVPGLTQARHWCAKVEGVEGKAPVIQIGPRSAWQSPRGTERHRACWTRDLNSDEWYPFDHVEVFEDSWQAWNEAPFAEDVIYIGNIPSYTNGRYEAKKAQWLSNALTSPTESGNFNYLIGTMPELSGPNDKLLPAIDCHAFKIGTGPEKFVIISGTHPDEIGDWIFEAIVDTLVSGNALSLSLLSKFTFYVYPNINPQGLYGGYCRAAPDVNRDCNRIWFDDPMESVVQQIYRPAWIADVGGDLFGLFDCHSTPGADPTSSIRPSGREVWAFINDSSEDLLHPFLSRLDELVEIYYRSMPSNTVPDFFKSIAAPRLAMALELDHRPSLWIEDWKQFGVDALIALDDVTGDI